MPKQRGVFKINGTIDDMTFYERKGVFFARRATKGTTKQQILTSPRYAQTRENMAEFKALAVTTKSIVSTVSKTSELKDGTLRNRLMRTLWPSQFSLLIQNHDTLTKFSHRLRAFV